MFFSFFVHLNDFRFVCFLCVSSITVNAIQITFQMQIENPESSLTPPTPVSPLREVQSPEALASISSGSSDNASGKVTSI